MALKFGGMWDENVRVRANPVMLPSEVFPSLTPSRKGTALITRIRKLMEEREGGFTLIELLVVMIIIGILAAIAIPVFLSQRAKAQDSAAKADVSTLGKEIATYFVDGTVGGSITAGGDGVNYEFTPAGGAAQNLGRSSKNVTVGSTTAITSPTAWCVAVNNDKGDKKDWHYSAAGGLDSGAC